MIPFTPAFFRQLQTKHQRLETELTAVKERLQVAREQGDLSENAAYKYAKFELGSISRQLRELNRLLKDGKPVDPPVNPTQVEFGVTVRIIDLSQPARLEVQLVSAAEANPQQGKVSLVSPLGAALLGKRPQQTITVETPAGRRQYLIQELR